MDTGDNAVSGHEPQEGKKLAQRRRITPGDFAVCAMALPWACGLVGIILLTLRFPAQWWRWTMPLSSIVAIAGSAIAFRILIQNTVADEGAGNRRVALAWLGMGLLLSYVVFTGDRLLFRLGAIIPAILLAVAAFYVLARRGPKKANTDGEEYTKARTAIVLLVVNGVFFAPLLSPLPGSSKSIKEPESTKADQITGYLAGLDRCFVAFAEEHPAKWLPRLSSTRGRLLQVEGEFAGYELPRHYQDWRFFYLGYELHSEAQLRAFADVYRKVLEAGGVLIDDLAVPGQSDLFAEGKIRRLNLRLPPETPEMTRPPLPAELGGDVPVLIERIDQTSDKGGHVLFLDGHIEYIEYPGRWPMTEKTMTLLRELDGFDREGRGQ